MIVYLIYTLKVSLCLIAFYLVYLMVFRNSTLFMFNRLYLLTGLVLSFTIPVLKISIFKAQSPLFISAILDLTWIEPEFDTLQSQNSTYGALQLDLPLILAVVYFTGISVLFFKLLFSITRLIRIKSRSETYLFGRLRIVKADSVLPFSFFNMIVLPKSDFNPLIMDHELTHFRQFHWFDLLLIEIASLLVWFNPFVVLYKSSLKLQHEYLADDKVIRQGNRIENYLDCLLQRVQLVSFGEPVSHFYCKTIKKRIVMIIKNKTPKRYLGWYMLILPLSGLLLFAFSGSHIKSPLKDSTGMVDTDENCPSIYPVNSKIVTNISGYGERINPYTRKKEFHFGIDFALPEGEEVYATAAGTVIEAMFQENGKGNYILIGHSNIYSTLYTHLQKLTVKKGDVLKKGQVIGSVGNTGISTGPHLHYEVYKNGEKVNPSDYLPRN